MDYKKNLEENIKTTDLPLFISKEYYKKHPRFMVLNIVIMSGTSLIGLVITGIAGVVFGFVIGILAFRFLPPVNEKIKEIYNH